MKIVKESIILEQKKLALAAGLVIIQDNKILLGRPTDAKKDNIYSIPKGHIEEGESILEAAIRETREEVGVDTDNLIIDTSKEQFIDYMDKNGNLYKRMYYYLARPKTPITKFKLQQEEIAWAGFLNKRDAMKRIFWRFKPLLKYLK